MLVNSLSMGWPVCHPIISPDLSLQNAGLPAGRSALLVIGDWASFWPDRDNTLINASRRGYWTMATTVTSA